MSALDSLLAQLADRIDELEQLPYPAVRDKVLEVLQLVDALHRPGLAHLHQELLEAGLLERVGGHEAVRVLFALYGPDPLPPRDEELAGTAPGYRSGVLQIGSPVVRVPAGSLAGPGEALRAISVAGRQLLFVRHGEGVHAVDAACPNCGSALAEGKLAGSVLVCPVNNCAYDLATGNRVDGDPAPALAVYRARAVGDEIVVEIGGRRPTGRTDR